MENITKRFGSVVANNAINMELREGEILSLLGENGSGKTTLMNMLSGIYFPDEGQIYIHDQPVTIASPKDAFDLGIGMIHQHFKLVDLFTATENIILGLEGNTGVAAYGVVANISLVAASIYTGMAQGVQPLISRAFGRGDQSTIRQVLRYALVTVLVLSCLIYAMVFIFTGPIVQAFNSESDPLLREIAINGMKLYFTSAFFMGFNTIISVFFTSVEKAAPAQLISLLRGLFVIIPTAFIMSELFGITGVWLAFPVTEMIVAAAGAGIYMGMKKQL